MTEIIKQNNIDNNKKLLSETIGVLRFPLMVCVVLQHIFIVNKDRYLFTMLCDKYIIPSFVYIAVPLFFFISGFLFFIYVDNFGSIEYFGKIKKRMIRLVIPFLLWGVLALVIKYIFYRFGGEKVAYMFDHPLKWIYLIVWRPVNYPLWFIRDLIFIILISPVIYFLIKRLKFVFVFILGIAWLCWHKNIFDLFGLELYLRSQNIFDVYGLDFVSLFFFSFGAWFALLKRDFTLDFKRLFPIAIVLYVVFTIGRFAIVDEYWAEIFNRLAILFGLMSAVVIVYELVRTGKVKRNMFLESGSQFIYYYHAIFIMYYIKVLYHLGLLHTDSSFVYSLVYLSVPIITILLGLGLYKVGMKYCPKVMKIALGLK